MLPRTITQKVIDVEGFLQTTIPAWNPIHSVIKEPKTVSLQRRVPLLWSYCTTKGKRLKAATVTCRDSASRRRLQTEQGTVRRGGAANNRLRAARLILVPVTRAQRVGVGVPFLFRQMGKQADLQIGHVPAQTALEVDSSQFG